MPVKPEWIEAVDKRHPGMPEELRRLYTKYGYGAVGESLYRIHFLLDPSDIYGPETADGLGEILIVGDDFAGDCEAYDAADSWRFGSIGSNGEFEPYDDIYSSFIEFLEKWFITEDDT